MPKPRTSVLALSGESVWVLSLTAEANLDEVSGVAVDVDVRQLQTDDLTGLGDDESSAGELWPGRHEGEGALSGQHVQASYHRTDSHIRKEILIQVDFENVLINLI